MHRDMDLVRQILLKMDEHPNGFAPPKIEVPGYTDEQIGYHVALMGEAGLMKCVDVTPLGARDIRCAAPGNRWRHRKPRLMCGAELVNPRPAHRRGVGRRHIGSKPHCRGPGSCAHRSVSPKEPDRQAGVGAACG